jgi:hypothetical protein
MSTKSLSYLSDIVTQEQNRTGITSPILVVDPDDGTLIRLLNDHPTADSEGLPIFADFRDGGDNPLPTDTKLILRAVRPTDDEPTAVSVAETNIAPWNNLSVAEQRNEENIDAVTIELKGDRINIRDKDILRVELDSAAQVDWTNSQFYFARKSIRELDFDG